MANIRIPNNAGEELFEKGKKKDKREEKEKNGKINVKYGLAHNF